MNMNCYSDSCVLLLRRKQKIKINKIKKRAKEEAVKNHIKSIDEIFYYLNGLIPHTCYYNKLNTETTEQIGDYTKIFSIHDLYKKKINDILEKNGYICRDLSDKLFSTVGLEKIKKCLQHIRNNLSSNNN